MNAFELLLAELEGNALVVVLAPCRRFVNEGGCIRVCASLNATWYRRFCAAHASSRGVRRGKFDTRIRRAGVARLLRRLAAGLPSSSKYAPELARIAAREAARLAA